MYKRSSVSSMNVCTFGYPWIEWSSILNTFTLQFYTLKMASALWVVAMVGLITTMCSARTKFNGQGKSFSSVIKGFNYKTLGKEVVLFEKEFPNVGYLTEQWYTSGTNGPFNEHGRIRIYIDGEDTPTLDYMLTMGQAVNGEAEEAVNSAPWSSRLFGRLAKGGGYFNTFRIPFGSQIKITVTNEVNTGNLW